MRGGELFDSQMRGYHLLSGRSSGTAAAARLQCRLDVLVEAEQVRRIVFVLQGDEPLVALAVGGPDPRGFFRVEVVDIHLSGREGLHCRPELPGPLDMISRLVWIGPLRDHVVIPLVVAQPEGSRVPINSGGSAVEVEKQ